MYVCLLLSLLLSTPCLSQIGRTSSLNRFSSIQNLNKFQRVPVAHNSALNSGHPKSTLPSKTSASTLWPEDSRIPLSSEPGSKIISESVQELAFTLTYEQYLEGNTGNVLFSPLSIASLLSLLMMGANGTSNKELRNALYYKDSHNEVSIHQAYRSFFNNLTNPVPGVELSVTTNVFVQQDFPILGHFIASAIKCYNAEVSSVNFRTQGLQTMNNINIIVNEATNGKIAQIVQRPFNQDTTSVLINTIYFNGLWENPFDEKFTYDGTFETGTHSISIPMMVNEIYVPFLSRKDAGIDMIALPYKGNKYSLYVLKPKGDSGIQSLIQMEQGLSPIILNSLINEMKSEELLVSMPRMSMKERFSLKKNFKNLNVTSIWGPRANFRRMTNNPNVYVNDIIHEAVLEITETGTVAAAATITTTNKSLPRRFIVDKPCLLFIRDDSTGIILFWAKLIEPIPLNNNS